MWPSIRDLREVRVEPQSYSGEEHFRRNHKGKGFEQGVVLECSGNSKKASVHCCRVNKGKGRRI